MIHREDDLHPDLVLQRLHAADVVILERGPLDLQARGRRGVGPRRACPPLDHVVVFLVLAIGAFLYRRRTLATTRWFLWAGVATIPLPYIAALAGWMLPNEAIRLSNVKADPDYVKIQQLVIIKTSALNGSAYCMSHNVPLGKKIGLTEAQIAAAQGNDYRASPDLDEKQKAAVRWAEAVTKMTARDDDDAFAEMKRHFSEKQIVELTVFCGMWNYSNRLCEALHVDLERPDKRIEFQK